MRATIINLQRKALVMEVYNPYSIVQVSEVLDELTVRRGIKSIYLGKAVVISMVNTGLTALVSVALIDEWRELSNVALVPGALRHEAGNFVREWDQRFCIRRDYQVVVNEMRAFLAEVSRWVEQVDMSDALPKQDGRLREDVFFELAEPLMEKTRHYFDELNGQAALVDEELAPAHRAFVQAALHPLILRAPFVFRTYTKPLGYAGDYQMVRQILDDPRQGPSTYFQIVNAAFLQTAVAHAHRNRIDILVDFLAGQADAARLAGRPFRVLNVGCGPAVEIQRFLQEYPEPHWLAFELVDFSEETLAYTRATLAQAQAQAARGRQEVAIDYVHDSVHQLLKRRVSATPAPQGFGEFDAVYCAGLFDYLSDKVCIRLINHFVARMRRGGRLLLTNVHSDNPEKAGMEHLLEWYLIYRDQAQMAALLPPLSTAHRLYVDATGVNVFAEASSAC